MVMMKMISFVPSTVLVSLHTLPPFLKEGMEAFHFVEEKKGAQRG